MRALAPIRRSRAAEWSRLIGALSVPVLVIGALGTRTGFVPGALLISVLVLGFALALIALGLAMYSLADIWTNGAEGAGAAIAGVIYALPALVLLGGVAAAAIVYPRLTDISTDLADPPDFQELLESRPEEPPREAVALQRRAYPDVAPRAYSLPVEPVYEAVRTLVRDRGWEIRADIPLVAPSPPAAPVEEVPEPVEDETVVRELEAKGVAVQSRAEVVSAAAKTQPQPPPEPPPPPPPEMAALQATARTPLFGFSDHVVLRIRPEGLGTRVDMRSASGTGMHDLGQNARRIKSFMADLDVALQPILDGAAGLAPPVAISSSPPNERGAPVSQ